MKTRVTATVIDGAFKLDQPVELPDQSRVTVTIEPVSQSERSAAWGAVKQRLKERPIHSGGRRFTRGKLRERR